MVPVWTVQSCENTSSAVVLTPQSTQSLSTKYCTRSAVHVLAKDNETVVDTLPPWEMAVKHVVVSESQMYVEFATNETLEMVQLGTNVNSNVYVEPETATASDGTIGSIDNVEFSPC